MKEGVDHARKLAMALLRSHQTDLRLWHAYAEMEKYAGNIDKARNVYDKALSMLHALPTDVQASAPLLYRAYAEMEMAVADARLLLPSVCENIRVLLLYS